MMSQTDEQQIQRFWYWAAKHKAEIDSLVDTSDPIWDQVLGKLQEMSADLWFEVSSPGDSEREFVITAEGKRSLFPLVEAIVSRAPKIHGWRLTALKPPRGFTFKTRYEEIPRDPKSMSFLPLERADCGEAFGLRVAVPSCTEKRRVAITTGVMIVLETALGERYFANDIQHVEVCSLPKQPEAAEYLPLPRLPEYIAWRKRKRRTS